MSQTNYIIVSIEGNIGSGKSTLMEHLKKTYKNNSQVIFLKEPVDEWENIKDSNGVTILEKFYTDQEKYSFAFQMMAYVSRLNVLRDTLKTLDTTSDKKYIIITERSLNTDRYVFAKMLFETGKMEDVFYQIYLNWFDTFSQEFPVHKIVYVKVEPHVCHKRISKRDREGEGCIPVEYLEICHKYHEEMLQNMNESLEKLILNGNVDIHENTNQMEDWLHQINNFIH
jgi:deoxyadenosine/deoxycytidine kinase